jgi:hypothetical protein
MQVKLGVINLTIQYKNIRKGLLAGILLMLLTGINVMAVILHPGGEPAVDFSNIDIPDPNVIGRWGGNASCVAIGRNLIITTTHQDDDNANTLRSVRIGGVTYTPDAVWTTVENDDIRIVKLHHANLNSYVDPYLNANEIGKEIVIGGYGKPRGNTLTTSNTDYGYIWANSSNAILRFCTNRVEDIDVVDKEIIADFDDLAQNMTQSQTQLHKPTTFEGTITHFDSGGGWFIKDGVWKLAGLTWGVKIHEPITEQYETWFRDPNTLLPLSTPDHLVAWRISDHQSWINAVISSQPNCPFIATDLNDDCVIDESDLFEFAIEWLNVNCGIANNYCQGADFDGINGVDMADFAQLASDWLYDYTET